MGNISSVKTTPHALSIDPELGKYVQQLHKEQRDLEQRLLKDTTKTKSSKKLFAAEAAQKRLELVLKKAEKVQQDVSADLSKFDTRIENLMQVRGTTYLLVMQNYAAALADKKVSEIVKLNDIDALRACLLIPTMKFNEGIKKQQDKLHTEAEKLILAEDYDEREQLKEKLSAAEKLELGLLAEYDNNKTEIEFVKQNMVLDDGIEPALG